MTYATLLEIPDRWLHRTDLGAHAPEFIAEAHARISRDVTAASHLKRETWTITAQETALPADFVEFTAIPLDYIDSGVFYQTGVYQESTGTPAAYTIDGQTLVIAPPPVDFSLRVTYRARLPLDNDNQTNAVLAAHPDLYRHAVLVAACNFVEDFERMAVENQLYQAAAADVNVQEQWSR